MSQSNTHTFVLCLASNSQQEPNMESARRELTALCLEIRFTSEHWTAPVNTTCTGKYLNQLARGTIMLDRLAFEGRLKQIETVLGRRRDADGIVAIDIDLLLFDDERFHLRDWERDYVKELFKEL